MAKPRKINVEPLLFLMSFGFGLYSTVYVAFITFKHCLWLLDSSVQPFPNPHDYCLKLGSTPSQSDKPSNWSGPVHPLLRVDPDPDPDPELDQDQDPDLLFLNKVQAAAARYMIYYQIISTVPTVVMTVFIGAWSDKHGRKLPMVIALAGSAIAIPVAIVTAAVDWIPVYVMLAPAFIKGFTGQMLVVSGGSYAMISDAAMTPKELTIRIAVASGVSSVGSLSAHLIAGVILQRWDDYTLIFVCTGVCTFLAFVYAAVGLEETIGYSREGGRNAREISDQENTSDDQKVISSYRNRIDTSSDLETASGSDQSQADQPIDDPSLIDRSPIDDHDSVQPENSSHASKTITSSCASFLHVDRIKESVQILIRERPGRRRFYLVTTIVSFSILFATQATGVLNLFAKRPPLSFTNSQYSFLTSAGSIMMFAPIIFTWLFKVSDISLILIGLVFHVFKMGLTAFSTEQWMLFTALGVGGLATLEFTGFRSFMTKLVEPNETGRLFATVSAIDHLTPLLASALFNNLYAMTLSWFPGLVFLVSAVFDFLILLVISYLYIDIKRHKEPVIQQPSIIDSERDTDALVNLGTVD